MGIRLTPAGVLFERAGGKVSMTAWSALDPERPVAPGDNSFSVTLRPSGADEIALTFDGTDADFVQEAIAHYAAEPERRSAIGTAAELDRLQAALPAPDPETLPVLKPGMTRTGVVVHLLILIGGIVLAGVGEDTFWLKVPGNMLTLYASFRLIDRVRAGLWLRRRLRRTA